jgi:hypothetical protein
LTITGSQAVTCQRYAASGGGVDTPSINFGTGSITTTGSGTVCDITANNGVSGTGGFIISNNTATASSVAQATNRDINFKFINGTYALTITGSARFGNLDFTGFAGSWNLGSSSYTINGSLTLAAGMTFTASTGSFVFNGTGTQTIISAGKTLPTTSQTNTSTVVYSGNVTFGSTTYTLTSGRLDIGTNTVTFTCGAFSSANSNVRGIDFGTGNIRVSSTGTAWNFTTTLNASFTGTPTINLISSGATTVNAGSNPNFALNSLSKISAVGFHCSNDGNFGGKFNRLRTIGSSP